MEAKIAELTGRHAALVAEAEQVARDIEIEQALLRYFPGGAGKGPTRTIREMVKEVMGDDDAPLGIRQMIDAISARFGATIARTSISPILRKMLDKGEVEHIGDKWKLAAVTTTLDRR